jgi:hypothetical protein
LYVINEVEGELCMQNSEKRKTGICAGLFHSKFKGTGEPRASRFTHALEDANN